MMKMIKVIKAEKAAEILKANGYTSANAEKIKMGLEQRVYPFGDAIQMSKRMVYDIYEKKLMKWIQERDSDNTA